MKQVNMFLAGCAEEHMHQAELFELNSETAMHCEMCGAPMCETPSGWVACPNGHGKLLMAEVGPSGSWFE